MFTRRQLRIKVMQTLYACYNDLNKADTLQKGEKQLFTRIHAAYRAYLYLLLVLRKTTEYVQMDADHTAGKLLIKESQKKVNTILLHNSVTQALFQSDLEGRLNSEDMAHQPERGLIRSIHRTLKSDKHYQSYLEKRRYLENDHKHMLMYLAYDILLNHDDLDHHIESHFYTWEDDKPMIAWWVKNMLEQLRPGMANFELPHPYTGQWEQDKSFCIKLFKKTVVAHKALEAMIARTTRNWDVKRLTIIDRILMEMALSEFLYFPEIPPKVSLDEYIEIAKLYSTPRSKDFINGVLDRLMRELDEAGKIPDTASK